MIWEFNQSLPRNHVLDNSLDVVSAVQTLAIKIQASGQCIAYFEHLQIECDITVIPLSIPMHSNVHWGTADRMLGCAYYLHQPMNYLAQSWLFNTLDYLPSKSHGLLFPSGLQTGIVSWIDWFSLSPIGVGDIHGGLAPKSGVRLGYRRCWGCP